MEKHRPREGLFRNGSISLEARIQILLEEYRALYSLLTFRLTAMDRRLPAIGGVLAAILGGTTAMPEQTRLAFLLGLPFAQLWHFFSAVQHARSKEDHLRRIDEIERQVNCLVGEELLVFQSRHPRGARLPSGSTGFGAVLGLLTACWILLGACLLVFESTGAPFNREGVPEYAAYLVCCALLMLGNTIRLRRYRYRRQPAHATPMFEVCRPSNSRFTRFVNDMDL